MILTSVCSHLLKCEKHCHIIQIMPEQAIVAVDIFIRLSFPHHSSEMVARIWKYRRLAIIIIDQTDQPLASLPVLG